MLTPNIDVATAHTFNANPVMSSTGDTRWDTLNSGDKLTGDGVGSVLNIITVDEAQGAGGQSATKNILPTITNVETLNANVYHELNINSQYVTGMKNVNLLEATHDFAMKGTDSKLENVTVSNLENNVPTLTLTPTLTPTPTLIPTSKPINATFQVNSTYLTGDADALNLAISNVVQGVAGISTIDVESTSNLGTYETLNIASNGAKTNQIFLKSNSANLGISGGAVEIDAKDAKLLATVDATASAGNVKLYNVDANGLTSVKLGDGDDIISIKDFNAKTTIDTGAGADLVAIKDTPNITAEKLNNISNAETIRLSGSDATIDFDKLTNGVKNFEVASDATGAAGSFTFNNVAAGSTFKVITNDWLGFSDVNGTGSYNSIYNNDNNDEYYADVKALKLNGTKGAATSVTLTNNTNNNTTPAPAPSTLRELTTDSNDLSLVSTGKSANFITNLTAGSGSATAPATVAIKISGDQDFIVGKGATLATATHLSGINVKGFNVDATALTGALEIHGSNAYLDINGTAHVQSDIIKGGAGNDVISTGTQFQGTSGVKGVAAQVGFLSTGSNVALVQGNIVKITVANEVDQYKGAEGTYTYTLQAGDSASDYAGLATLLNKATNGTKKLSDYFNVSVDRTSGSLLITQKAGTEHPTTAEHTITATDGTGTAISTFKMGNADPSAVVVGVQGIAGIDGSYDVLTGGAGADKFVLDGFINGTTNNKIVTTEITDFKSGEDKLVFSTKPTNGDATNFVTGKVFASLDLMFDAAIAEFKATKDAAGNAKAGDTQYYVAQVGQDTYVINDGDITSVDGNAGAFYDVVKLTGVALSGIAASDIVATA